MEHFQLISDTSGSANNIPYRFTIGQKSRTIQVQGLIKYQRELCYSGFGVLLYTVLKFHVELSLQNIQLTLTYYKSWCTLLSQKG